MDRPDTNNLRLLAEDMEHDADHVIIKEASNYIAHLEAENAALKSRVEELEGEGWQPIVGWDSEYEVSCAGQIRKRDGSMIVGQWQNNQGYMLARLSNPRKVVRVHRVVAEAFLKNEKDTACLVVNHKNFNRRDNRVQNLEWCSQAENITHSDSAGRMQRDYWTGKRSPNAKLSDGAAQKIRDDKSGLSLSKLADKYGTNKRTVLRIRSGQSYNPIPSPPLKPESDNG